MAKMRRDCLNRNSLYSLRGRKKKGSNVSLNQAWFPNLSGQCCDWRWCKGGETRGPGPLLVTLTCFTAHSFESFMGPASQQWKTDEHIKKWGGHKCVVLTFVWAVKTRPAGPGLRPRQCGRGPCCSSELSQIDMFHLEHPTSGAESVGASYRGEDKPVTAAGQQSVSSSVVELFCFHRIF